MCLDPVWPFPANFRVCHLPCSCKYVQFQKQSGGGGIDGNINGAICEVLEGGAKPTGAAMPGHQVVANVI